MAVYFVVGPLSAYLFSLTRPPRSSPGRDSTIVGKQGPIDSNTIDGADAYNSQSSYQESIHPDTGFPSAFDRPAAFPCAIFGGFYIAVATLSIALDLPEYHKHFFAGGSNWLLGANVSLPLFYIGALAFCFKSASGLQYRPALRLDNLIYNSGLALLVQWGICVMWIYRLIKMRELIIYPIFGKDATIPCGLLRTLYESGLPGRIAYSCFAVGVSLGHGGMLLATIEIRLSTSHIILVHLYRKVKTQFCTFVLPSLERRVLQPLSPVLNPLGKCTRLYMIDPLKTQFTGPSSKEKDSSANYHFPEPDNVVLVATSISGGLLVMMTSPVLLTMPRVNDGSYLGSYRAEISFKTHVVTYYSLVAWLLWRYMSALNFTLALRLDMLVYTSRLGWIMQSIICVPWAYSLYIITRITRIAFFAYEGPIGYIMASVPPPLKETTECLIIFSGAIALTGAVVFFFCITITELVCLGRGIAFVTRRIVKPSQ